MSAGGNQIIDGDFEALSPPSAPSYAYGTFAGNWGGAYGTNPAFPAQIDPATAWYSNAYAGITAATTANKASSGSKMAIVSPGNGLLWQPFTVDTTGYYALSYDVATAGATSGMGLYTITTTGRVVAIMNSYVQGMPGWNGNVGSVVSNLVPVVSSGNSAYTTFTTGTNPLSTVPLLALFTGVQYLLIFSASFTGSSLVPYVYIDKVSIIMAPTISLPLTAAVNTSTTFPLGSLADPNSGTWTITVTWGDGSSNTVFTMNAVGQITPQAHTYTTTGFKTVTMTAKNNTTNLTASSYPFTVSVT